MQFAQSLFLCASLVASVSARIAFTTLPQNVQAGNPVKLAWEGGDGTPVTITLKQGDPNNLKTVALITGDAKGNSYTWTPSTSLPAGSNYALQISQDDTDINYTGLFSLTGGSSSSATSAASSSASSSNSSSRIIIPGTGTGSTPTASGNGTVSVTATAQTTATSAVNIGTGVSGGTGASTGIYTSRNATLSRPTLSRTSSSSSSSETASATSGQEESTGTTGTTAPTSRPSNAAVSLASNFALLLAGFAAVAYVG